ncbi:hypothetical protein GCM10009605_42840 [Nocardiopsis composta]
MAGTARFSAAPGRAGPGGGTIGTGAEPRESRAGALLPVGGAGRIGAPAPGRPADPARTGPPSTCAPPRSARPGTAPRLGRGAPRGAGARRVRASTPPRALRRAAGPGGRGGTA